MVQRLQFVALTLATLAASASSLEVVFAKTFESYSVEHGGSVLFSSGGGIAVFCEGSWHSQQSGNLTLTGHQTVSGTDFGLGTYSGIELSWLAGKTPLVTTAKTYKTGTDVVFQYAFPNGAEKTSTVQYAGTDRKEVIVNFPAFTEISLPSKLSWTGSFVRAVMNDVSTGPAGGPAVFFNSSDTGLRTVVVGGALDNFKATSAGPGTTWNGTKAWVPGTPGTITSLPKGWTQSFLLHMGSTRGITAAIGEWGDLLQSVHRSYKIADPTLEKIGYQTDNGAYYVFCGGNCSDTLLKKVAELKDMGVPMGYLSFQGDGASSASMRGDAATSSDLVELSGNHDAPWCVNTWGVDGALGGSFPLALPAFQKALGVPLQLYAPYFCPGSDYFNSTSNWTSVKSDLNLTDCSDSGFQDVTPDQSREFYDWFFAKGEAVDMVSFEPDFMYQNYNCVPAFVESATNSTIWQHGMADAALAKNMTVQWCYAAATDVLASLTMPSVTNFRVSYDFCYGQSWDVGVSSLIVWAAGAAPSKDTLWTSANGRFAVPGCSWTPDHEEPAAEMHVVVALMTTGPVGISDGIGFTNAELIKRTITADGTLLKPSKPATSVDSFLAGGTVGKPPPGQVLSTFSRDAKGSLSAYYFVSFKMQSDWSVEVGDFYPALQEYTSYVFRAFDGGVSCKNGTAASACVKSFNGLSDLSNLAIPLPKSDMTNVTGGTDFTPVVTTVWPVCESGWVLLGDLTKYVAVSTLRFPSVKCTMTGISVSVVGTPMETVPLTLLKPRGAISTEVLTVEVTLPASGATNFHFDTAAEKQLLV